MQSICEPVTGGVIVATAVLPDKMVMKVVGTIVAAAVTVTGNGCRLLWTVLKFW
jgi:hypothetical protein